MAELADALDLGSSVLTDVQVQFLSSPLGLKRVSVIFDGNPFSLYQTSRNRTGTNCRYTAVVLLEPCLIVDKLRMHWLYSENSNEPFKHWCRIIRREHRSLFGDHCNTVFSQFFAILFKHHGINGISIESLGSCLLYTSDAADE